MNLREGEGPGIEELARFQAWLAQAPDTQLRIAARHIEAYLLRRDAEARAIDGGEVRAS